MKIKFRQKIIANIENDKQLSEFIKNKKLIKHFKCFNKTKSKFINLLIKETNVINFKDFRWGFLKKIIYMNTHLVIDYWIDRGYSLKESKIKIQTIQSENSNKVDPNKRPQPTRLQYWIDKGFSENEAKIKLSERQTTFSLEKCIEKFGDIEGTKRWENRQKKWSKSIKKYYNIHPDENKLKNSRSLEYIKKTKKDWVGYFIDFHIVNNEKKEFLREAIKICKNKEELIDYSFECFDFKRLSEILFIVDCVLINDLFVTNIKELKEIALKKMGIETESMGFGILIYKYGNMFRSWGEYNIAKFLEENSIKYECDKRYPNTNYRYDFFIPEINIFIEYTGMLSKSGINNNLPINIKEKYLNTIEKKKNICNENNYKYFFSGDCEIIIEHIRNKIKYNNESKNSK